jgi:hypothetical protein
LRRWLAGRRDAASARFDRADVADRRQLAAKERGGPWGKVARSVEKAIAANRCYGTSVIWARYLMRRREVRTGESNQGPS